MWNVLRSVLMFVVLVGMTSISGYVAAAEKGTGSEISSGAAKAEAKYQAAFDKIIEKGHKKIDKEKSKLITAIEKDIKAKMRQNDLAAANVLNNYLETVKTANPIDDTFSVQRKEKVKKVLIHITRAIARRMKNPGPEVDVRNLVQAYVDKGHTTLTPGEFLLEKTGIKSHARLIIAWTYEGEGYSKKLGWWATLDLINSRKED